MLKIEYLTDKNGQPKAVVILIGIWKQMSAEEIDRARLLDGLENYSLDRAMDEAKSSPLLN